MSELRGIVEQGICHIMIKHGPDGHVDGYDKIADYVMAILEDGARVVFTDDPDGAWRIKAVSSMNWTTGAELNKAMRSALVCAAAEETTDPLCLSNINGITVDMDWSPA